MSNKYKITIFLACSMTLLLLIFGGSIYYFQKNYSYTDFYERLETRVSIAEKYYLEHDEINAKSLKELREKHLAKQ